MRLGWNLIAGFGNSLWTALIGLVAVPFYLRYLGVEAYGLIGLFVTVQTVLTLLDMGMSPTVSREVARDSATGGTGGASNLVHTLAFIYWSMAAVIAAAFLFISPWIASHWLNSGTLSPETTRRAALCIGLVIACRWPIGLYQAVLIGAHRVAYFSIINVTMVTIGTVGGIAVLAFVASTIEAFFLWQAGIGFIYALVMRWSAWTVIGPRPKGLDLQALRRVWRFTLGMSAVSLFGVVFGQVDKVLLSKLLSLEGYAHYMLATALTGGLYVLVGPIYNVAGPRFSALIAAGDMDKLHVQYNTYTRTLAVILFPACMVLVVASNELVFAWTANGPLANSVAPLVSLMAVGSALNGIMQVPHALQLAFGSSRLPLMINCTLMVVFLPMVLYLASNFGGLGGALAWLVLHVLYLLLGTWLTHRRYLIGYGAKWLLNEVGVPMGLSVAAGVLLTLAFKHHETGVLLKLGLSAAAGLGVALVAILMTPQLIQSLTRPVLPRTRDANG